MIELTVPREDRVEVSSARKTFHYEDIRQDSGRNGWRTTILAVEVGCRGFAERTLWNLMKSMGFQGREKKTAIRKIEDIAEKASTMIWKWSHYRAWGRDQAD